jgi:hypothetical protein
VAQRTWLVRPDHQVASVDGGVIAVVSQESLLKAVMDGAIVLDRCGGHLAVSLDRTQTGVPGERVTTNAMVTWKDRTDSRAAPEQDGPSVLAAAAEAPSPVQGLAAAEHNGAVPVGVSASGEEVDESDVPLELRG